MSLTLSGWLLLSWFLAASSIVLAFVVFPVRSGAPRSALVSRLRPSSWAGGRGIRGSAGPLIVAAAAFLLVAGVGVAASYLKGSPSGSGDKSAASRPHSGPDSEILGQLKDYTRSIGTQEHAAAPGKLLPDVNTMVERLAARLQTAPGDAKGWRTLAWSYFHMGRYQEAVGAFAKAVELDPESAELKRSYEEAKAKASARDRSQRAAALHAEAAGKGGDGPHGEKSTKSQAASPHGEATSPHGDGAAIRAMVDGLANRLEKSPRDVEGWTRLMRSRVVLGEKEVAATAFRKALEVFKDDQEASSRITASATELGLKTE
jgi:cytochrome c-type biogenesis protein CcmH